MSYARFPDDGATLGPGWPGSRRVTSLGFIAVPAPIAGLAPSGVKNIYEMAYEQACAALRPSRYDHLVACLSN
jgi:hypothetical protein